MGSLLNSSSSSSRSKTNLMLNDESGVDGENLSVSRRLARNLSQKLKKKKKCGERLEDTESDGGMASPSGCLSFHVKGSGCRVGSCEDLDLNFRRRLSFMEDCKPGKSTIENAVSLPEKLWRKGSRKDKGTEPWPPSLASMISLPDDVLEMILSMLPWTSLMAASSVCRKWRSLIGTNHFMQKRSEGSYQKPCLFLFGITRNGFNRGEIHALDISLDQWSQSSHDELKNRFLFSVVSIGTDVCIVGGCWVYSSSRSPKKSLKEVLVFSPIKGSFHEAAPMNEGRTEPVLGVFEVSSNCKIFHSQPQPKARASGNSDVYGDPHKFSLRRRLRDAHCNSEDLLQPNADSITCRKSPSNVAMIAVGGHGSLDEPLDSGEIYDPITNRWVEIARLPEAFGPVCSGTVCNSIFYVYSEADKLAGFDLENGFWTMIQVSHPPLHLPDYHPKLVSCKNRLFLLCVSWCMRDGSVRREKAARKMWELDLKYQSWNEVSRHPDAPMDSNAFFVADQKKIYGVEMFRIFGQVLDFVTACDVSDGEFKWNRVTRKHAAHEADALSCITKSMLVVNL